MSNSYSYDLRQKVIKSIELDGLKKIEASQMFNIIRNTINLWFQRRALILKHKIKTTDDYCKNTRKNKIDLESVNIICRST